MENTHFFDDFPINTFIYNGISYCQVSLPANVNPGCGKGGNCCSRILCFESSKSASFWACSFASALGHAHMFDGLGTNKCTSQGFHCSTSQRKPVEEEENTTYLEAPKQIATSSATTMFWKTAVQLASGAGAWRLLIGVDRSPWDGKPDETGCSGLWGTSDPL